jgi:hypothetical protein
MRLTEDEYNALISRRKPALAEPPAIVGAKKATGQSRREPQAIRQSRNGPNKTEKRFEIERLAPAQTAGGIWDYQFEAVTLRLANGCKYTPDFFTYGPDGVRFYEVKGAYAREDAKVKLKVAASQFKCFEFYLAQWIKGEWTVNKVLP